MKRIILCFLCFAFIATDLLAQERPKFAHLGVRPSRLSSNVTLLEEQVEIELGPQLCLFQDTLKLGSTAGTPQITKLGLAGPSPETIQDPLVLVDAESLPLERSSEERVVIEDKGEYEFSHLEKIHWILWKMDVGSGQQRTAMVSYAVPPRIILEPETSAYLEHKATILREFDRNSWEITPVVQTVLDGLQSAFTGYRIAGYGKWKQNPVLVVGVHATSPFIRSSSFPGSAQAGGVQWQLDARTHPVVEIEYNPFLSRDQELVNVRSALRRYPQSESLAQLELFLEDAS